MSAMITAMMPRALNVFAWTAPAMWAALIAGAAVNARPDLVVEFAAGALASTGCALRLCQERRTDARAAAHIRNQALMTTALELAAGKPLQTVRVPSQPCEETPGLKVVRPAS